MASWWRPLALAGGLAVALAGLAACGSSGDGGSAATTTGATTAATTPTTAAVTTAAPTTAATTTEPGGPTTTDPDFSGAGSAEFCGYIEELEEQQDLTASLFGPDATPETARQAFDELDRVYDKLAAKAPSEIRGDLDTAREYFDQARAIYERNGYDFQKVVGAAAQDPSVSASFQFADNPEFVAASDRVNAYVEKVCGVKPE